MRRLARVGIGRFVTVALEKTDSGRQGTTATCYWRFAFMNSPG